MSVVLRSSSLLGCGSLLLGFFPRAGFVVAVDERKVFCSFVENFFLIFFIFLIFFDYFDIFDFFDFFLFF